jgi:hypothetical protein
MPVLVVWLAEMLMSVIGQLALSAIAAVGIGFATRAVGGAVDFGGHIRTVLGQAGPLYDYVIFLGMDQAITIVLSAWAGRKVTDAAKAYFVANKIPRVK